MKPSISPAKIAQILRSISGPPFVARDQVAAVPADGPYLVLAVERPEDLEDCFTLYLVNGTRGAIDRIEESTGMHCSIGADLLESTVGPHRHTGLAPAGRVALERQGLPESDFVIWYEFQVHRGTTVEQWGGSLEKGIGSGPWFRVPGFAEPALVVPLARRRASTTAAGGSPCRE